MRIEQIMNKLKNLFFLVSLLLVSTSHSLQDNVVAIVNDKVILQSDLDERMREVNIQNLSRIEFAKIKNGILDQLIEESLLDQASSRMGIRISDIDLQNRLKLIAKNQGLTVLQLKDAVEKQNISYMKYLDKLRRNIQRQELFRTQFDNRAYISDEEIESFLTSNKLPQIDARMKIKEYIIQDKTNKLNLSQATIVLDGVKATGLEDEEKKYPAYDIKETVLDDIQVHKLPDIYQSNLQLLDKDNFSRVFKTGKGFTMLHVLESNVLVEEYNRAQAFCALFDVAKVYKACEAAMEYSLFPSTVRAKAEYAVGNLRLVPFTGSIARLVTKVDFVSSYRDVGTKFSIEPSP